MNKNIEFEKPRKVESLSDCLFYHEIDLPGIETVNGRWDLRPTVEEYLGGHDFQGKTVLDIGAASGFLSFATEKRGAQVVSFDMADPSHLNFVPYVHPDFDMEKCQKTYFEWAEQLKNSYWFAHGLLESGAKAFYGNIYNIPEILGDFDVILFGMVLPHLRDPFQALYSGSLRAKKTIIITQQAPQIDEAYAYFMPDSETLSPEVAWWSMSEKCVEKMLGVVGFDLVSVVRCEHLCANRAGDKVTSGKETCSTFVAQRKDG